MGWGEKGKGAKRGTKTGGKMFKVLKMWSERQSGRRLKKKFGGCSACGLRSMRIAV